MLVHPDGMLDEVAPLAELLVAKFADERLDAHVHTHVILEVVDRVKQQCAVHVTALVDQGLLYLVSVAQLKDLIHAHWYVWQCVVLIWNLSYYHLRSVVIQLLSQLPLL